MKNIFTSHALSPEGYYLTKLEQIFFILTHPSWIFFLLTWRKTIQAKEKNATRTPIDFKLPWITFGSIHWLEKNLSRDSYVFEYGSGGSTLFLADRVSRVISIEHDKKWFEKMKKAINDHRILNVSLHFVPPIRLQKKTPSYSLRSSTSIQEKYKNYSFTAYVQAIDKYPDHSFDLIIIDGRSRISCTQRALRKIKRGGYLLLDNSERREYAPALKLLTNSQRTDFFGFGPFLHSYWKTSIWKIM